MTDNSKLTELQQTLREQLSIVENTVSKDERHQKVKERVTRIVNGLIDASSAFKATDSNYNDSIVMLETTVDVVNGVVNVVKNVDVNDENTISALRIVLHGLNNSVRQFRGTHVSEGEDMLEGLEAEIENLGYSIELR
jgi:hypothetical protein